MNYKDLYKDILKQISGDICTRWPESGFSHATWADLAGNCTKVYKALANQKDAIPQSVCLGRYSIKGAEGEKVTLPYAWDWCKYRGIVLSPDAKYEDDISNDLISGIRKVAASFLLRLAAQVTDRILIHKVDINMDGDIAMIPNTQKTPTIVDRENLNRLFSEIKDIIANHSTGFEWRCDTAGGMNPQPLKIVFISNWDSLFRKENDGDSKFSDSQEEIMKFLRSEVAAKNGIYFVICASNPVGLEGLTQIRVSQKGIDEFSGIITPVMPDKRDKDETQLSKDALSPVELLFAIPSDDEVQAIHLAKQKRDSGALEDDEVDGKWTGNSAKGLRAIMGTTPQGENQYFELGIGRATDAFHALVGGATGSGKSVLLNEIICSLAERYSPNELRMILLDYKEGTEFSPYRNLPHVLALSAGSNVEFGYETLKWLKQEMEERGKLFKEADVANVKDYRQATGKEMCRYLFVADEFQVLFGDKKYGTEARALLNDFARRGRSLGVHMILSTQTLKDGSLDGEAKNQFSCRICLRLAESETSDFLSSDNNVPATFTQKGAAVLNYALGQKSGNIFFRSGNNDKTKYQNGFREREHIVQLLTELKNKAIEEGLMLEKQYIYDGDDFASLGEDIIQPDKGFILGLRNNMAADPYYLSNRHVDNGVIIIGSDEEKVKHLLQTISAQTSAIYGTHCPVMSTEEYLDRPQDYPLTIIRADEGDMNLEDAIIEWQEVINREEAPLDMPPMQASPSADIPTFAAPEGMGEEFAEMMQGMHFDIPSVAAPTAATTRASRKRKGKPIIISLPTHADARMLESFGLSIQDFRISIYTDAQAYNQLTSGDYESGKLPASQVMIEYPRGVVNKICVGDLTSEHSI